MKPLERWVRPPPIGLKVRQMRVVRGAVLEGQDARVLDNTASDLDRPSDGRVRVPRLGAGKYRAQVGQQSLADLPGGRVPQVRRAVVHAVVVNVIADREHRLSEGCRPSPAESHALVTGHVHEETAGPEGGQAVAGGEHPRGSGG